MSKEFLTAHNNRIFSHMEAIKNTPNKQKDPLDEGEVLRAEQEAEIIVQEHSLREREQNIIRIRAEQDAVIRERAMVIIEQEKILEDRQQNIIRIRAEQDLEREALVLVMVAQAEERERLKGIQKLQEEERDRIDEVINEEEANLYDVVLEPNIEDDYVVPPLGENPEL